MATGDLDGNLERLKSQLRRTKFAGELDEAGLRGGELGAVVAVLQHVLLRFSRHVAQELLDHGHELQGKPGPRLAEAAFRVAREHFGLRPRLTLQQFLDKGFAERKVLLLHDLICKCVASHNEAVKQQRLASLAAQSHVRQADAAWQAPALMRAAVGPGLSSTVIRHPSVGAAHGSQEGASMPAEALGPSARPASGHPAFEEAAGQAAAAGAVGWPHPWAGAQAAWGAHGAAAAEPPCASNQALQARVDALAAELGAFRAAGELQRQQLQARIVVLETRLRAWEGMQHRPAFVQWAAPQQQQHQLPRPLALEAQQWQPPADGFPAAAAAPAAAPAGKENQRGSGAEGAAGKWQPGHATSVERLLRDIHSRYTEAQELLAQQLG